MNPVRKFLVLLTLLAVIFVAACVPAPATPAEIIAEPANTESVSEVVENTIAPDLSSLSFVDGTGKQVNLPGIPQRIVVAGKATPYVLDTLYMFPEIASKLIALEVRGFDTQAFLELVDPKVQVKTFLDLDSGPEQIAPHNPDLVILKNISLGKLGATLEEINIPVMGLNLETPEAFYADLQALGIVLGNQPRADELVAFYQSQQDMVAKMVAGLSAEEKPSVLVLQYTEDGSDVTFTVPPAAYLQTTMIQNAGANPVWLDADGGADGWIQVSLEQIAAWDPEMVFVVHYGGDSNTVAQTLMESPLWQDLQAAKTGQIYGYPADFASWDLIDPRWILGEQWLVKIIQPERAKELDLIAQVKDFYRVAFGLSDQAIEESVLPKLDELK
ncbi:MAG: hypothetical protein CVU39_09730 [Chloroflexi bacterium HGW-Chloroflexi-10]|nr:MAG: hypothetical protein CVU39_09730 [Chloroflexi bacterium HGW-Chloroflexi-10]